MKVSSALFHLKKISKRDARSVRSNTHLKHLLAKSEVLEQFQIPEFVLKTQLQIIKDFATVGSEFSNELEKHELDYNSLVIAVAEKIIEVMKLGEPTLLQLLYQIDLPQQDFLTITTDTHFTEKLADMIIRREAYKVYLRSKF